MNPDGCVPEAKKKNHQWLTRIQILIALGLMVYLLQRASLGDVLTFLKHGVNNWPFLVIGAILPVGGLLIAALRWKMLLGAHSFKVKLSTLLEGLLIGAYFNQFLPSTIGGDVARGWWIVKKGNRVPNLQLDISLPIVLVDRLVGVTGILSVGVLAIYLNPILMDQLGGFWVLPVIIFIVGFITLSLLNRRMKKFVDRFFLTTFRKFFKGVLSRIFEALLVYRNHKMVVLWAFCLSISFQFLIIIQYMILARMLELNVPIWQFSTIIPIVTLIALMPITINGIGLREGTLAFLGGGLGLTIGGAVVLGLNITIIGLVYSFAGGFIFLFRGGKNLQVERREIVKCQT